MAFTFFFRDSHSIEQALKYFLPIVNGYRKIRIWDAGCAMGPEPYTFAIMLAERMGYFAFKNVEIDASDIDETDTFGKIITDGIYPESELTRIPKDIFNKYFTKSERDGYFRINDNILSRIRFQKHDLLELKPFSDNYNMVICKNVLLHFQPKERIEVIKMFHSVLAPQGLFLTEQTQQVPEEISYLFKKIAADANVYQKA
ncbi:MAG: methyltransferase domain-containing protein [Ignavibacteria bacterium]|nr:methyltransferase domain-containing protein [Ignavibacteria bacterium]